MGARSVLCDNGAPAQILYYILSERQEGCVSYGAEIIFHREGRRESAVVRHITTSRGRMEALARRLCRSTVTPCTLREIIDDELKNI